MEKMQNIELYDIYTTWHIPFWQTAWFYYMVVAIVLITATTLLFWLIARYRNRKTVSQAPWQIALAQLQALQTNKYSTKAAGKQCYFTMTSILKQYLHAQYQLRTIGKTDDELIRYLQKRTLLAQPILKNLEEICKGCLYIKFANQEAVKKQISAHLEMSVKIVESSRPNNPANCDVPQ